MGHALPKFVWHPLEPLFGFNLTVKLPYLTPIHIHFCFPFCCRVRMSGQGSKKRLTQDTECFKVMEAMLINRDFDENAPPKEIWSSNPIFQEFPLNIWRTKWNKMKAEHGINLRQAQVPGGATVAGAPNIAAARAMLENLQQGGVQQPRQGPAGGQANLKQAPDSKWPAMPSVKAVQLQGNMPPLAMAAPMVYDPEVPYSKESVNETDKTEFTPPHMLVKLCDARARRDKLMAFIQCNSGLVRASDYHAEIRIDDCNENKVLAVKSRNHPAMEMAEILLKGLQGKMEHSQMVLARQEIDKKVGELKGEDNSKQIQWTFKLELPVAVSSTFVDQGIFTFDGMTFLVIQMEAQEANKMQQKSNFGDTIGLEQMPDLNL